MIKTVRIKQKHIDKGKKKVCSSCPTALALNEALGGVWTVTNYYAKDLSKMPWRTLNFNDAVRTFINRFDYDCPVEPMSFKVELLENDKLVIVE